MTGVGSGFIVAHQATALAQPREGALDDPPFGQGLEAFLLFVALHYTQLQLLLLRFVFGGVEVASIHPQAAQLLRHAAPTPQMLEQLHRPGGIGYISRCHHQMKQQTEGVHAQVTLAPNLVFGPVIAALSLATAHGDALAVDVARAGVLVTSGFLAHLGA